jgi:hypothetical protein
MPFRISMPSNGKCNSFLLEDNLLKGVLAGVLTLTLILLILNALKQLFSQTFGIEILTAPHAAALICLSLSMLVFRWLIMDRSQFETGRGFFLLLFIVSLGYLYFR